MKNKSKCKIVSAGKRRDGGTRYWCLRHRGDATAKYGVEAEKCRFADIPEIQDSEIIEIDVSNYLGGVGLWGSVPPIYDTTRQPLDRGIHVHARRNTKKIKEIDETYRMVRLIDSNNPKRVSTITELDAIYYMISTVFGYEMKYIECTRCQHPHLDKDWFSLNPHKRHLCAGCGQYFRDSDVAIGNPILKTQSIFNNKPKTIKKIKREIEIKQSDYEGGIQIWGSNPAIFWTNNKAEEEGIHLHAFSKEDTKPKIDNTYSEVIVDGVSLDSSMVRMLMAQKVIPHIKKRVFGLDCPSCNKPYLSVGKLGFTPTKIHNCTFCKEEFQNRSRLKNVISNPLINDLAKLSENAVQEPQKHDIDLLPETI